MTKWRWDRIILFPAAVTFAATLILRLDIVEYSIVTGLAFNIIYLAYVFGEEFARGRPLEKLRRGVYRIESISKDGDTWRIWFSDKETLKTLFRKEGDIKVILPSSDGSQYIEAYHFNDQLRYKLTLRDPSAFAQSEEGQERVAIA